MSPECETWADDMTPHCFNSHADDPVATLPFYVRVGRGASANNHKGAAQASAEALVL